jgi:hypothetical protein
LYEKQQNLEWLLLKTDALALLAQFASATIHLKLTESKSDAETMEVCP